MDAFSYLSVLISIILGLGITQLLTNIGRLIRERSRVRFFLPPVLWAVLLLIIHVQTWWAMFGLRQHTDWTFFAFLNVLLQPIVLYLLSAVVLPDSSDAEALDLSEHYYENTRWFFGLMMVLLVVSVLRDLVIDGELPSTLNLAFHGVFFCMTLLGAVLPHPRWHQAGPWLTLALIGIYIALLFRQLQ